MYSVKNKQLRQAPAAKRRSRKPTQAYVLVVLIVVLAAGFGAWAYKHHQNASKIVHTPQGTINYSPATKQDNASNNDRKSSANPGDTLDNGSSAATASFAVTVNANPNGSTIHVGTLVNGTTSGSCTLTVSQTGQQSIVKTASVQQDVNNYDCGVFNITPTHAQGQWTITLTVTNNGKQASNSTTVTL